MSRKKIRMYGQVFLVNQLIATEIVATLNIEPHDIVLEIGIGEGILTNIILQTIYAKFFIVEIDRILCDKHIGINCVTNTELLLADATSVDLSELSPTKIISNLPYASAKKILLNIIMHIASVEEVVFMIQKEVGDSILQHDTVFGCLVGSFFQCSKILNVDKKYFIPVPKVQSMVIRGIKIKNCNLDINSYQEFLYKFFSVNNKKLGLLQALHGMLLPEKFHHLRAHQLSVQEIIEIYGLNHQNAPD